MLEPRHKRSVSSLLPLIDETNETRSLVGVAFMALADLDQDDRTECLRIMLLMIEDRLRDLSSSLSLVNTGGAA